LCALHRAAEGVAAGGQFADEVVECFVVGVAPGLGVQDGDGGVGGEFPVGVEAVGVLVEEGVAGEVRRVARVAVVQRGVHRAAEVVGRKQIHPAVADDRRPGEGVQDPLQGGPRRPALAGPATGAHACAGAVGGLRQVEQVGSLGVVELQRAGDRVEDGGGGTGEVAAFELGVVLDAHAGRRGHLAAAESGDPPGADVGQAGLLRGDLGSFVTGAGSGIGRAAALAFARDGADVVVADVAEHDNQNTAGMIDEGGGAGARGPVLRDAPR
jgi:hypothetical protein